MKEITVVDARMGRGKSSAAIRYMNRYRGEKRFLYITPYLDEVGRVCEKCDFDQPENDTASKSSELKHFLAMGYNVATTHSLFYLMDEETLELIRSRHYSLIIDENINVTSSVNASERDILTMFNSGYVVQQDDGFLKWMDTGYTGVFAGYKAIAEAHSLYYQDTKLLNILNPGFLRAFDEVFMLTYMFDGQYTKAYLDFFGFDYKIVGVELDELGYRFSDRPDCPPPVDYRYLINIIDERRMNGVGDDHFALSKAWYIRRGYTDDHIRKLRNSMYTFFKRRTPGGNTSTRLWTCFKNDVNKLVDKNSGRYRRNFLQVGARAVNRYGDRTDLAYMVNRFADPNITKFFSKKQITIDTDKFALSEMLQWIWRSAIRNGKPINLYIPSKRMRDLLVKWIDETSKGGMAIG